MTHPLQSRAERSKLHLSILEAVGDDSGPLAAFAEAIAWADSGDIADLGTLFSLADAITFHIDQHVYRSDCQYAEVMADDLRELHGTATVNLALKLAGIHPRRGPGAKAIWTDAPMDGRTRTVPVLLEPDILEKWNAP